MLETDIEGSKALAAGLCVLLFVGFVISVATEKEPSPREIYLQQIDNIITSPEYRMEVERQHAIENNDRILESFYDNYNVPDHEREWTRSS